MLNRTLKIILTGHIITLHPAVVKTLKRFSSRGGLLTYTLYRHRATINPTAVYDSTHFIEMFQYKYIFVYIYTFTKIILL